MTHCTKNQSAWNRGFLAKESLNHHWRTPLDLIVNLVELHYSCHNFGGFFRRYGNWWSLFEVAAIFVSVALVPFSWLVQLKVRLANHPRYVALYSLLRAKYRFGICMECRCHKISVNHCKKKICMAFMLKIARLLKHSNLLNRIRTVMKMKKKDPPGWRFGL